MTIIAATSPEIKALNLPFTPNFPSYLESSRRSLDLSPSSMIPQPSMTRARSMRERVSFFIDQMDDVEDIPSFASPPPQHKSTCSLYCNEHEDDLLRSLHSPTIMTHHAHRNKENIHPNSMLQTPNKNTLMVGSRCEDPSLVQKSSCHTRRKSFHRRDSTRSLPSPAEIGASPIACDSETPRHKNASICPIAFPSGSDGVKELSTSDCRSNMQPSICMAPKSLHLSTGFR